jgi:hypothetical protein
LALVVLDGPLGILLIPIAFALRWLRKDRRYDLALAALIPGALLHFFFLFVVPRRPAPNGASIERFIHILGGQVFLSSLLGVRTLIQLFHWQSLFAVDMAAILVGLAILGYALRCGPMELKLFLIFADVRRRQDRRWLPGICVPIFPDNLMLAFHSRFSPWLRDFRARNVLCE